MLRFTPEFICLFREMVGTRAKFEQFERRRDNFTVRGDGGHFFGDFFWSQTDHFTTSKTGESHWVTFFHSRILVSLGGFS